MTSSGKTWMVILVGLVMAGCGVIGGSAPGQGDGLVVATAHTAAVEPTAASTAITVPTDPPADMVTAVPSTAAPPDLGRVQIALEPVVAGLAQPVGAAQAGDARLFVLEKAGTVAIVENGAVQPTPFLDIRDRVRSSGSEQGLLGLAFHPDYAANGLFYVHYSDLNGSTVIARFRVTDDPNRADPSSESLVLALAQPAGNHNGGNLVFGPDGYLYIGMGDGGAANDAFGNGQNTRSMLGAMLRLDVDGGDPYAIPPDNPFVDDPDVLDEIWAFGLRNPWRYSFDRLTGDLFIADVGQNTYEEVHVQPADSLGGENYGWPIMEGFHCFRSANCDTAGLEMPVAEYDHTLGCSITGGYVYRGSAYPSLQGVYLFGDYCSGRIWGLARQDGTWQARELLQPGLLISAFGEDAVGEIYVMDINEGGLYRIVVR